MTEGERIAQLETQLSDWHKKAAGAEKVWEADKQRAFEEGILFALEKIKCAAQTVNPVPSHIISEAGGYASRADESFSVIEKLQAELAAAGFPITAACM